MGNLGEQNEHTVKERIDSKKRATYPQEIKDAAKKLFLRRYSVAEIGDMLNVPVRTLYSWASTDNWDDLLSHETVEEAYSRRLAILVEREDKSTGDLKELEVLVGHLERLQKMKAKEKTLALHMAQGTRMQDESGTLRGGIPVANPFQGEVKENNRPARKHKKPKKNDVSHLTIDDFKERIHKDYFQYQKDLYAQQELRNRMILKSRQIGLTWYLAREKFERAVLQGRNQIFLSATKNQSLVFNNYIKNCALEAFDIQLTGTDHIVLKTAKGNVDLRFLASSSQSAQSYNGDVTIDEFFWIRKFNELYRVASGMATHSHWKRTLISTPSYLTHEAYYHWSDQKYQSRTKKQKPWPSEKDILQGLVCPDNVYRKIITLDNAIKGGFNLVDVEELRLEYSPEEFKQLFECVFIDPSQSVFTLKDLENCLVDPATWGINFLLARPVGDARVWCGYDPARFRDDATFAVLLPPQKEGDKIRVLERHSWKGMSYLAQVELIKAICRRYRVSYMGIDVTGCGQAVFENVQKFCPVAQPIVYSVASKSELVLKGKEVMAEGRLEYDEGDMDITTAFLMIKQAQTQNGGTTYVADRNAKVGHADIGWAILHGLHAEPLAQKMPVGGKTSSLSFSD